MSEALPAAGPQGEGASMTNGTRPPGLSEHRAKRHTQWGVLNSQSRETFRGGKGGLPYKQAPVFQEGRERTATDTV